MSLFNYSILRDDLHDGNCFGIRVDEDTTPSRYILTLFCKRDDGVRCTIVVPKVLRLRASNFLQGNIINEIRVYKADQCTPELVDKADNVECKYDPEYLSRELEKMRLDKCILIEMETSYGCELAVIACCDIKDIRAEVESGV